MSWIQSATNKMLWWLLRFFNLERETVRSSAILPLSSITQIDTDRSETSSPAK
jgi:hypothetical protein